MNYYKSLIKLLPKPNSEFWTITLILGIALGVRLVLFTGIVRNDDLDYIHLAQKVNLGVFDAGKYFSQPIDEIGWRFGLYLPLAFFYRFLGPSEFPTILFPLTCSLLTVFFLYKIGVITIGKTGAILGAFLWAMLPLDIHLATDFMPDGPMTAMSTASAYFFIKSQTRAKPLLSDIVLAILFMLWAIAIKPYALVTLFFFIATLLIKYRKILPKIGKGIKFASAGTILFLLIAYIFAQNQNIWLLVLSTSQDLINLFFGLRPNRFDPSLQGELTFLAIAPLLILSMFDALAGEKKSIKPLLIWIIFTFPFAEWGPSRPRIAYSPNVALAESRNFLFLFPPLVLLAGHFIGRKLRTKPSELGLSFICILSLSFAYYAKQSSFDSQALEISSAAFILAIFLPFFIVRLKKFSKSWMTYGFLLVFSIAFIFPTPPAHFTEERFRLQTRFQENLIPISEFLKRNPALPIVTFSDDTALNLNYISNLSFGFDKTSPFREGVYRIELDAHATQRSDSFYTVFYSDYRGNIPGNWWKIMQVDKNGPNPVYLYRSLSEKDAVNQLAIMEQRANENATDLNLFSLFGAAQNAGDLTLAFSSWQALRNSKFEVSLKELEALSYYVVTKGRYANAKNIINSELAAWRLSPGISKTLDDGALQLELTSDLPTFAKVYQSVSLQPNSLYYFEVRVESTVSTRILSIPGLIDTYNHAEIYSEPELISAIFTTPNLPKDYIRVDINFAEARRIGSIWLSAPKIIQLANLHD